MGRNYSFFMEILSYILEEMFKIKLDFTITDNTVVFRFGSSYQTIRAESAISTLANSIEHR